jgi:hypothetical protein
MNPFKSEQAALPLMINTERQNLLETGQGRAWGAALTLILIVMALNLAARASPASAPSTGRSDPVAKRIDISGLNVYYGDFRAGRGRLDDDRAPAP